MLTRRLSVSALLDCGAQLRPDNRDSRAVKDRAAEGQVLVVVAVKVQIFNDQPQHKLGPAIRATSSAIRLAARPC
jgi:hypothetical protein